MKRVLTFLFFLLLTLFLVQCEEDIPSKPKLNIPPETDIFISTADSLNPTTSIQRISWDGRDADGFIVGFYYTWKDSALPADWTFTTEYSMTFPLEISGEDTSYVFQVKAVDDGGAEDPTPARQRFPIKNSPPVIKWTRASRIPDTTFTVASFIWEASDLDGDSTIQRFEYSLDDSSSWRSIPGYLRVVTLDADSGLTPGPHSFYIRAVDIAGAKSETIRMPEDPTQDWFVKEPNGQYLLVDGFVSEDPTIGPDSYYRRMMQNVVVPQGENFDYWNINEQFPASNIQFTETLKLYNYVIWYSDVSRETDEKFIAAQVAIPQFLNQGGKIIYSTQFNKGFGAQGNPLEFSPVDTLSSKTYRSLPNSIFEPDSAFAAILPHNAPSVPVLKVPPNQYILGIKALGPKVTSVPMYSSNAVLSKQGKAGVPLFVVMGRNDNTGEYDFVFAGVPFHQLNGNQNLDQLFDIVLNYIFK